jgi:hypothetical protein
LCFGHLAFILAGVGGPNQIERASTRLLSNAIQVVSSAANAWIRTSRRGTAFRTSSLRVKIRQLSTATAAGCSVCLVVGTARDRCSGMILDVRARTSGAGFRWETA